MSKTVLILGRGGVVTTALMHGAWPAGLAPQALPRAQADLTDPDSLARALDRWEPALVLNGAGWTDVAGAEKNPAAVMAVNGDGVASLARLCAARDVALLHLSTDYVFGGDGRQGPFKPTDSMAPVNAYGHSKAAGEEAIRNLCPRHLMVRTAWLLGGTTTFDARIRSKAKAQGSITVVDDQHGSPTPLPILTEALPRLCVAALTGRLAWGTWHAAGAPHATWADVATVVLAGTGIPVTRITTPEGGMLRPRDSRLDSSATWDALGWTPPTWQSLLDGNASTD